MNTANPFEPPTGSDASAGELSTSYWAPLDLFAIALWLAIPVGVFLGQRLARPMFEDFDVRLPMVTVYLVHSASSLLLALAAVIVILAIFSISNRIARRRYVLMAIFAGGLVGLFCLVGLMLPLWALVSGLS